MAGVKSGVFPVHKNSFKAGENKTKAVIIKDMESFSVSIDNGIEEWHTFDEEGWARRLLTAKSISISLSGKRSIGDPGNDYCAGKSFAMGRDAEGYFEWTFADGTVVALEDAIFDVKNNGAGDSTNVAPLEFDVLSNGKPKVTLSTGGAVGP